MSSFQRLISAVFHPLLMPLYGLLIVIFGIRYFTLAIHPNVRMILLFLMIMSVIVPAVLLGNMRRNNLISDLEVTNRSERHLPFLLLIFWYGSTYLLLRYKINDIPLPIEIYSMLLGVLISLVSALVLSFRIKLSIHMLGVSGILGLLVSLATFYKFNSDFPAIFWIIVLTLVSGLVGTSRRYFGYHSLNEILLGAFLGFVVNFMVMNSLLFI